ncbi:MAG: PIN domain-containing protein [Clostridiales bacterium]|jgi:predicted nucleic acid-binding protein|nr:PIN domain-containing protein [Clostridiales bacterium]
MTVLIDTNVVLDVLLGRALFATQSAKVLFLSEKAMIDGYISASAATDIFYVARKEFQDKDKAYEAMEKLFQAVKVAAVDSETIDGALELRWNDFEDCVQFVAARGLDAKYIVTRDMSGFNDSEIVPITPAEFLNVLKYGENEL